MLALPGSSTISTAWCQDHLHHIHFAPLSLPPHKLFSWLSATNWRRRRSRWKGAPAGSFFVCLFFPLWPCEGETRCYGELKFQNGAYHLYFSPLMRVPSSPHLPSLTPPFYLNHTSNNEWEDRARGSTLVRLFWEKKLKNRCIADLHRWVRNILSNLHYVVWWYERSPSTQKCCLSV